MRWEPIRLTGDTYARQLAANAAGAVCYVEQHLNAVADHDALDYALAIVASNASHTSKEWAKAYATRAAAALGTRDAGVLVGPARGSFNVKFTKMPAILCEPAFCSHRTRGPWLRTPEAADVLGGVLADSICAMFPHGGRVGLSVGHIGRPSQPHDRGAPIFGGGWEADAAGAIVTRCEELLRIRA